MATIVTAMTGVHLKVKRKYTQMVLDEVCVKSD